MKVNINCHGNERCGWATIELPTKGGKDSIPYLWIGAEDKFFGTIEDVRTLKKLRRMIDIIIDKKTRKP